MATIRTASDIIDGALRLVGVLAATETAPAVDSQLTLTCLQDLLADWSGEGLIIPTVSTTSFTLVAGTSEYRIGEVGAFTLGTTLNGATETQVDVGSGNIPSYAPQTGTLRIVKDAGGYDIVNYTSHDGSQYFTIPSTSFIDPLDATAGNAVYIYAVSTARPEQILTVMVRDTSVDYPVTIIGEGQYQIKKDKGTEQARPTEVWIDYDAPLIKFTFWPEPDATDTVLFSYVKPLLEPDSLTDDMLLDQSIPRNYHQSLRYNLAVIVAPYFGREPSATVQRIADRTKLTIINQNAKLRREPIDAPYFQRMMAIHGLAGGQ